MKVYIKQIIAGCWLVLMISQVMGGTETSDGATDSSTEDNGVKMIFYQTSPDKWKEIEDDVKDIVAKKSTMYCGNRQKECGMIVTEMNNDTIDISHHFLPSDVKVGTPKKDRIYLEVPFAVKLPINATSDDSDKYLNKKSLKEILKSVTNDVKQRTGQTVRRVGDFEVDYPPNNTLNASIIPIVLIILLVLIIAAFIIKKHTTKQEHKKVAADFALEKEKMPVKLIEMRSLEPVESEPPPASTSAADDANQSTHSKDSEDAVNVTESAALLEEKDGNAVKA